MRKISYGVGVERIFLTEAPSVTKVEIKARGHVRRARLYYLRDLRGKKARLRSKLRDLSGLVGEEGAGTAAEAPPTSAEALPAEPEAEKRRAAEARPGASPHGKPGERLEASPRASSD